MQTTIVSGNLGKAATIDEAAGKKVLHFSVAVASGTDKNGKELTTWYDCSYFLNRDADGNWKDGIAAYLTKGQQVIVSGRVSSKGWLGKDGGEVRHGLSLTVDRIELVGSKPESRVREAVRLVRKDTGEEITITAGQIAKVWEKLAKETGRGDVQYEPARYEPSGLEVRDPETGTVRTFTEEDVLNLLGDKGDLVFKPASTLSLEDMDVPF